MKSWIMLLLITSFLNAGEKIALLIGNSDYSFQPLDNPLHDVDGIKKTLNEIGFDSIQVLKNASKTKMETELANFSQRATTAEIALIYFSGHGMQVNNTNYMFPAKTTATKPIHLRTLVDLDYFIESASSAKYGIILVDACRNNPLIKYFQNGKHKGSNAKKGLGLVEPTVGQVVIGFATSAGDTADDGKGNMSPYAKALSVRLKEKDDVRNILGKVGNDVSGKYEQTPVYRANLASSVCLNECKKIEISKVESELIIEIEKMKENLYIFPKLLVALRSTLEMIGDEKSKPPHNNKIKMIKDKINKICSAFSTMQTKILLLNELRKDKSYKYELVNIEIIKEQNCKI